MPNNPASLVKEQVVGPERWVDSYGDDLFRFAYKRVRDSQVAEELVQETFLAALRTPHKYSGSGSEIGWLKRIMHFKIIDNIRVRARTDGPDPQSEDARAQAQLLELQGRWKTDQWPPIHSRTVSGEHQAEFHELWQIVQRCLTRIPPAQADVFVLSAIDELESSTICELLGITARCLWVRLHRARLELAKCVGSQWFTGDELELAHE